MEETTTLIDSNGFHTEGVKSTQQLVVEAVALAAVTVVAMKVGRKAVDIYRVRKLKKAEEK